MGRSWITATENLKNVEDLNYSKLIDKSTAGVQYIGYFAPGTSGLVSVAKCKIMKYSFDDTSESILWASGNAEDLDKIWNNRASYSYS